MTGLIEEQVSFYNKNGYLSPIDIFSPEHAAELRAELESLEAAHPDAVVGRNRNNVHYVTPLFDRIAHNSKILDAVQSLIGPNILVDGSTLFIKEPD